MTDRFVASDDVIGREVGGEIVLLDLGSGTYFGLNEVGGAVWQQIVDGNDTIDGIVDALFDIYEADRAQIESDVLALLEDLTGRGLVTRTTA